MSQANPTDVQATTYAKSYILHGCQSTAFRCTFPDSKGGKENDHCRASILHATRKVQERIKELQAISKANTEKEFGLTVSKLKEVLAEVIDKGLDGKTDADGNTSPASLPAVVAAVKEFNLMDGNHAAQKMKVSGDAENPLQVVTMSPSQYKKARKEMLEEVEV